MDWGATIFAIVLFSLVWQPIWFVLFKPEWGITSFEQIFVGALTNKEFNALMEYILENTTSIKHGDDYFYTDHAKEDDGYKVNVGSWKQFRINDNRDFSLIQKIRFIRRVEKIQRIDKKTRDGKSLSRTRALLNQQVLDKMIYKDIDKVIKSE